MATTGQPPVSEPTPTDAADTFKNRKSPQRPPLQVWASASLGVLLLGFAVTDSSALPNKTAPAGKTSAPLCRGKAKRVRPAHISFSFACGNEDVTAFKVQANRPLHFVYDPNSAFDCERRTSRSFSCEDIHSGASSVGSGLATVGGPLCHPGAHLILRITPALNFESTFRTTFTLKGPC